MDETEFWSIIDESRNRENNQTKQYEKLKLILKNYSPDDIVSFDLIFTQKSNDLYNWDLWAIAYIINKGCSDDSFTDFRNWIISRGKDFFKKALIHPKKLGEIINIGEDIFFEEIYYVAGYLYEEKTGEDLINFIDRYPKFPDEPEGEYWEEDDLEKLYPELCKKFSW